MDAKCRLCDRPSIDNLDSATTLGLPVCRSHRTLIVEALREAATLARSERALGFGVPVYASDEHGVEVLLRCDRATTLQESHTWHDRPGTRCPFCLALYVDTLIEERNRVLSRPEVEIESAAYVTEIARRAEQLLRAVEIGLVTRDEAKTQLERWSAHV